MGEAKRRRAHEQMVALSAYAVVPFDDPADGQKRIAPEEFRLFHSGINQTSKGEFLFDDVAAESVMAVYATQNRKVPLMGDYEHQATTVPPVIARASAMRFVPEIRRDAAGGPELWATQVQWTEDARRYLEAGEYRFYSPTFLPSEDGRIRALINFALTNLPASYDIEPLVAASAVTPTGDPAVEEELKKLKGQLEELSARCEKMNALCLKRLGKSFDDWENEQDEERELREKSKPAAAALTALTAKISELTGKTDTAEALGVLALAVTQGKELVSLKQQIVEDRTKALETEFASTVDAAVAQGKLPPAGPVSKEFFVSLKADFGTERALVALKKAIPAEPIVQLTQPRQPNPSAAVSDTQVEIASMCGGRFGGLNQFKNLREAEEKARAGAPTT